MFPFLIDKTWYETAQQPEPPRTPGRFRRAFAGLAKRLAATADPNAWTFPPL